jgi:hypothetical protein
MRTGNAPVPHFNVDTTLRNERRRIARLIGEQRPPLHI